MGKRPRAFLFALIWVGGVGINGPEQKPVREELITTDPGRSASLENLWERSTVVVEAVVTAAEPADMPLSTRPGSPTKFRTAYDAKALQVFKPGTPNVMPGTMVRVFRLGGTRDRGEYVEAQVERDFPQFVIEKKYILFLLLGADGNSYGVRDGRDGVLEIDNGRVTPIGTSDVSRSLRGKSRLEVGELLDRMRGSR